MSWHYQVIRHQNGGFGETFEIHESYPDLGSITERSVKPFGQTLDDLRTSLMHMLADLDVYPVKDYEDF